MVRPHPASFSLGAWPSLSVVLAGSAALVSGFQLQVLYLPPQPLELFIPDVVLPMPGSMGCRSPRLIRPFSKAGPLFQLLVKRILASLLPLFPPGGAPGRPCRATLGVTSRHLSCIRALAEPLLSRISHRRRQLCAPKTETLWAGPHLDSQLICRVGLDFPQWVVLNTKAQLKRFPLLGDLTQFLTLLSLFTLFLPLFLQPLSSQNFLYL